jgi:hypothetical protein
LAEFPEDRDDHPKEDLLTEYFGYANQPGYKFSPDLESRVILKLHEVIHEVVSAHLFAKDFCKFINKND